MAIHARLREPLELRRDILESAIISTTAINSISELKMLGREKKKIRTQLIHGLNDLKKSFKDLQKKLPKLPKEEKVHVNREELREILNLNRADKLGGQVKPVEVIKKELGRIKNKKDVGTLRKKAKASEERERMRRELESIRGRISRLHRLMPSSNSS
jgi:hypothetical protein